jgi:hypothetical protein
VILCEDHSRALLSRATKASTRRACAEAAQGVLVDAPLRQVLINLVANAVKFTDRGGVALVVTSTGKPGAPISFAVEDTGPGIAPEAAEQIFGEFTQAAHHTGRRLPGSGLGLSISRSIVRRMGGDIAVSRRSGGGSVFSFSLELEPAPGGAAPPVVNLSGRRALVVAPPGLAAPIATASSPKPGRACGRHLHPAAAGWPGRRRRRQAHVLLLDQRAAVDPAAALRPSEAAGSAVRGDLVRRATARAGRAPRGRL